MGSLWTNTYKCLNIFFPLIIQQEKKKKKASNQKIKCCFLMEYCLQIFVDLKKRKALIEFSFIQLFTTIHCFLETQSMS